MRWALGLAFVLVAALACDTQAVQSCLAQAKPPGEVQGSLGVYLPCQFGPACGDNDPAYRPVADATLTFTSLECGGRSFRTTTRGDGTYEMALPEGRYEVAVQGGRPAAVSIASGRVASLNLRQDIQNSRRLAPVASG